MNEEVTSTVVFVDSEGYTIQLHPKQERAARNFLWQSRRCCSSQKEACFVPINLALADLPHLYKANFPSLNIGQLSGTLGARHFSCQRNPSSTSLTVMNQSCGCCGKVAEDLQNAWHVNRFTTVARFANGAIGLNTRKSMLDFLLGGWLLGYFKIAAESGHRGAMEKMEIALRIGLVAPGDITKIGEKFETSLSNNENGTRARGKVASLRLKRGQERVGLQKRCL